MNRHGWWEAKSRGVETLMLFLVALGENEKEMKREREEK